MLKLENISKKFKNNLVLNNINYNFTEGKIYLIKGRNGAGKTVLLKTICNLTYPNHGTVEYVIDNNNYCQPDYGIIIESPIFWKDKTGYDTLCFLASIRNKIGKEEINTVLKLVGLEKVKDTTIKKYSLGMHQRLAIAQAIMEDPAILLFDEPTNSLDDEGIEMFKKIILEEKRKGKIIIIVSHIIEELNGICDTKLILKNGELIEEC